VIEIIVGLVIGATAGLLLGAMLAAAGRADADAENRQMRIALRHIRGILANTGVLPTVARYIDRILDDEAGA
jgi:hypothetical protein